MMLYPASHWLGGLPQWSTDEEDVNGSGISESDMRAVRAQAARCRRQSPEAGGVYADDGAEYAELAVCFRSGVGNEHGNLEALLDF